MNAKTISMCQGKGSLSHNNREFTAKNIDPSRTADNIVFIQQDLGDAYHQLFDGAVERYNARQKRKDRMIGDYFEHLFHRQPSKSVITGANKQKSFYEDLVQIGTMDDTGVGTPDAEVAVACLREYMEDFQARNPNFYVFNAVLHLNEATPHLHINYIPVGHYDRGLDTRNAMAKALEEMGYGTGANAINSWRLEQWEALEEICFNHGIPISEPQKSRGYSYTVEEYGEHQDKIRELEAELDKAARKKVKLDEIENIEAKKSVFGKKVTLSKDDYDKLNDTAKKYVAMEKNIKKFKKERDEAVQKYDALKAKYETVSSELVSYKKAEEETRYFSREKLRKAMAFISACGLSDDFARFKFTKIRGTELE